MRYTRLWIGLAFVLVASFAVLGYLGGEIARQGDGPLPQRWGQVGREASQTPGPPRTLAAGGRLGT
jgi:hypothetical protein